MKNSNAEMKVVGDEKDFPMRLNRFLALSGVASRREADGLIEKGKVKVNGRAAELGSKVIIGDTVALAGTHASKAQGQFAYFAFFKGAGTLLDPSAKAWADTDLGRLKPGVFPADLLEKDAEGIVILTNDARVSKSLGRADTVEREYAVKTQEPVAPTFLKKLESSIELGGRMFKARKAASLDDKIFSISIAATRRDVERMCEGLHHTVLFARRERIANVSLKNLKRNGYREIKGKELEMFLERLGF